MIPLTFYKADGVEFAVDVAIDAGADLASLTGCTAAVLAKCGSAVVITGTATITSPTRILCALTAPAGIYLVQVRVTPPLDGHLGQTVGEYRVIVKPSL